MGRSVNGSYAVCTRYPVGNVVGVETGLGWVDLAAIPEVGSPFLCLGDSFQLSGKSAVGRGRCFSKQLLI